MYTARPVDRIALFAASEASLIESNRGDGRQLTILRRGIARGGPDGHLVGTAPADAGWQYIRFDAYRLPPGATLSGDSERDETALIILGGRCAVRAGQRLWANVGQRQDVWDKTAPYVALLPPSTRYQVEAKTDLHLAVAGAPAETVDPPRLISPEDVVAEERGEGQTYRYIQHLLPPSAAAARLILVEVYTPGGNWSSFPPHKHDTEDPPRESYLEETYYYQVKPASGFALQRVYTADRSLDETVAAGDGDLVLVPRGFHTVAATPGHDCYYLNVMAGPNRAWNFQLDPDYAALMNWRKPAVAGGRSTLDPGSALRVSGRGPGPPGGR
jgi:5-deoxy-glucuronate isomerase